MAKRLLSILLLGALAFGFWLFTHRPGDNARPAAPPITGESTAASPTASASTPSGSTGENPAPPASASTPEPAANPSTSPAPPPTTPFLLGSAETIPAMDPTTVLNNMRNTVNRYGSMFGGNPVGTNPEITRALNGDNPKQVKFISEDLGLRINGRGELVDYWGTPFFFHQLSGAEMEIRSAGPDKIMWTADDLVIK